MSLPPERLQELRQVVHNHVNKDEVLRRIQECVDETLSSVPDSLNESEVLRALQEKGVVNDILASLDVQTAGSPRLVQASKREGVPFDIDSTCSCNEFDVKVKDVQEGVPLSSGKKYLLLHVRGGRAFLEHVDVPERNTLPGHQPRQGAFSLHVYFRNQRFVSKPVTCACEPHIRESFLLVLSHQDPGSEARTVTPNLLSIPDPVQLVLVREDATGGREVAGTGRVEWRKTLTTDNGKISLPLELSGYGVESNVTVGVLDIQLEVVPKGAHRVQEDAYSTQLKIEENQYNEKERMFLAYAKHWWKEFLQIRPSHSQRLVKIFAHDEVGRNWPVFVYVSPLRAGRLLESPRHAARFVSLIPYEKTSSTSLGSGGCRNEVWNTLHSLLARKKGDCEDHAVLLCSLLLGFGLQAFVCVGTKGNSQVHTWVMTLGHDGEVTFWESLTGQRFCHQSVDPSHHPGPVRLPHPSHPYRTIGCVFNHHAFLANIQPSDSVATARFNLSDPSQWKAMKSEAIQSVRRGSAKVLLPSVVLSSGGLDPLMASNELETRLRVCLVEHRQEMGLETVWNSTLSYILTAALSAYEMERVTGTSVGSVEFQQAVRLTVPEGCTFKAFPIQFVNCNVARMFASCLKSDVCNEILGCRGDRVEHALRCTVYHYPEDTLAVWVMFAVQYQSVL